MSVRKRTWVSGGETKTAWTVDFKDQNGRRIQKSGFKTKRAAEDYLTDQKPKVKAGTFIPDSQSITVKEACAKWLAHKEEIDKVEASTLRGYKIHVNKHIIPALGDVKITLLTPVAIQRFVNEFHAEHNRKKAKNVLRTLKSVLSWCVPNGYAMLNHARDVKPPKADKRERRDLKAGVDFPTKEEMDAIIKAAKAMQNGNRRIYPMLLVAAHGGLRISEILGLQWDHVDFDNGTITVDGRMDERGQLGNPKSEDSARDVPMPPTLLQAMKEWKIASPKSEIGLVFPNGAGNAEFQGNLWKRDLSPLQKGAGVTADGKVKYGWHSFRHFYCSMLIDAKTAPKRIQELMGHSTLSMTMDTYGHLFRDENLADHIGGIFG